MKIEVNLNSDELHEAVSEYVESRQPVKVSKSFIRIERDSTIVVRAECERIKKNDTSLSHI